MQIQLLRHATLIVEMHGLRLLVDPMLSPVGALDPVPNAANDRRIPLVPLPLNDAELDTLLHEIDAVIVTHTHRDHWDVAAIDRLRKNVPMLCQPPDRDTIAAAGFVDVQPIEEDLVWHGITITRTGGQHGTGAIGQRMGPVSGFVLQAQDEPTLYIAGDTIWCDEVATALHRFQPQITILNAGAAQFLSGAPITMTAADVAEVCRALPITQVIAVHMETINHCLLTRAQLRDQLVAVDLSDRVLIPADGERHTFA